MEYRPLGRTGVQVSKLCLGTMMFGAWGNDDHDDSIRVIHRRPRRRRQLRRHRRRLLRRRVGGDRRQGAEGPARRRRAGDQVLHADGRGPQPARRVAALDRPGGRGLAAAARHRPHRPLPGAPPRSGRRRRGDARRAHRPRPAGQGPLHRLLVVRGQRDRRGAVGRARARAGALPHRAAALLAADPEHRARRPAHRPAPRHGHPHLQPARRRLALRQLERRQLPDLAGAAAARRPLRHGSAREPAQAARPSSSSPRSPTTPA